MNDAKAPALNDRLTVRTSFVFAGKTADNSDWEAEDGETNAQTRVIVFK